jgi:formylglycine-generating enzyme required for sulfatase activity
MRFFLLAAVLTISACAPISKTPSISKTQPVSYIEPTTGMEFVAVPTGSFMMGDNDDQRAAPAHQVTLDGFHIGMFEVTFNQYDLFCEETGREEPEDNEWGRGTRPVINVSWHDAKAFAAWLSERSNLNFSLPSEAQWEYAARASTTSTFWTGSKLRPNYANCRECGSQWDNLSTAPVGSFPPNRWGIYDMTGNVTEWLLDDYQHGYRGAPVDGSAWIIPEVQRKSQRGGAWKYSPDSLRSAARNYRRESYRTIDAGFRLVLTDLPGAQ